MWPYIVLVGALMLFASPLAVAKGEPSAPGNSSTILAAATAVPEAPAAPVPEAPATPVPEAPATGVPEAPATGVPEAPATGLSDACPLPEAGTLAEASCCSGKGGYCGCSGSKVRCCNGEATSCTCRSRTDAAAALEWKE